MQEPTEYPQHQLFEGPKPRGGFTQRTGGPNPHQDRQYDVQHLRESHHAMKRMCLMGYTNKEIAQQLEVSAQTVANVLNSAMMKRELELARAALDGQAFDIAAEVQKMAPKAVAVLEEILDNETAPITLRAKVAMDNLSRNGVSPVQRGSIDINHHFTRDDLEEIKRNAYAAGARNGCLLEEPGFGPLVTEHPCSDDVIVDAEVVEGGEDE